MKKLDVSQLLELCSNVGVENHETLTQTLLATLNELAVGVASKLDIETLGVENSPRGVLVRFGPRIPEHPCPPVLEAFDDEGSWHESPRTLLICDDDRMQGLQAREAVNRLGVNVIDTHSTEEAWQAYRENRVNLVITDIELPGQDGLELLRKIAAFEGYQGRRRKVPVITISDDTTDVGADVVDKAGGMAHLKKPIDWVRLGPVIKELCHAN
ncbi:response regulator [Parahaliea maris]|uniref:Response regulator n=1 Tax=Parahaliea maris TaxID=2716870 RepID=A0A5C9A4M0_9GAMM|nr:response regulator [Parahaliea maris]TXS95738.1 response regulator [Parahaliea maris]